MMPPQPSAVTKRQLERICYRCHRVSQRGSLCLLLLRESHSCPRRAFLQRHCPEALRPRITPSSRPDPNPLPLLSPLTPPISPPEVSFSALRSKYGKPLSRWHGLFARLGKVPQPHASDT